MQNRKFRSKAVPRQRVLLLAMLPCLAAYAADDVNTVASAADAAALGASTAAPVAPTDPQTSSAQGTESQIAPAQTSAQSADAVTLDAVIVTAQKREERIQDVPIAISVFSGKALDELKIEGGAELLRATPNVTFSKSNFAVYNFSIRGVGTKALSVTTDPGVAVSFNSTPLIRNRLFEQEYFDVDRIEVLRGPQGTLYGRNATGGVVNMIPNLPTDVFEAELKGEVGNFDSRRASGMVNIPLGDTLSFRLAGALTKRDGFDFNTVTDRDVNNRDLWGGRASLAWQPNDRFNASLVWEHFEEDDERSRTGKQLCHRDPGPETVDGVPVTGRLRNGLSQGCSPGSLYDDGAFGTPNGASLPQMLASNGTTVGLLPDFSNIVTAVRDGGSIDPFAGVTQSSDLRTIATTFDPRFEAENDVVQLNFEVGLSDQLKLISQTAFSRDSYYSTQDYSRFQSVPIFNDSNSAVRLDGSTAFPLTPGGVYTDPQLGPSEGFLAVDLVQAYSKQWSQEFRLQSAFDGPFNFSFGANYLEFEIDEDYFVFNNIFSLLAETVFNADRINSFGSPPVNCAPGDNDLTTPNGPHCVFIDPNPLDSINGDGHNYFRSRNLAKTKSAAVFGEGYWQVSDTLKITAGLRYTDDKKTTTPVPSQLLLFPGVLGGGLVNSGYPESPDIEQQWGALTGRFVVDWKPDLAFTDDTLLYASYARGYKAGGTNSPGIGADPEFLGFTPSDPTFDPEYINSFEIGMKNTLADGRLQLNASAFYYDYKDYQVSQIVDRATLNENFDAESYGLELEAAWRPTESLRLDANLGYLRTRIADGEQSIDVTDRTQGNPDWVVVRPWVQQASNCIAPAELVARFLTVVNPLGSDNFSNLLAAFCSSEFAFAAGGFTAPDGFGFLLTGIDYDPARDAPNGGRGFFADLGGNELPNAPHLTFNLGVQYTFFINNDWDLTVRGDYYYQGESWARVYNTEIDRLKAWDNINLSITLYRPQSDLTFQLYVKNLLDDTPITDAFINSDDTGLTTNVFTLDPRIIGFSVRKGFL